MPVPGYVPQPQSSNAQDDYNATYGPTSDNEARDLFFTGGIHGLTASTINSARGAALNLVPSPTLSPDAANAQFGIDGHLSFSHPITTAEAQWRQETKRQELYEQDIMSRAEGVNGAERFSRGLVGGIFDPISFGVNFIPFANEAHWAADAGLAANLAKGAWTGAKFGAAFGAAQGAENAYQGLDYNPEEFGQQILSSAVFGSVLEGGAYGLSRLRSNRYGDLIAAAAARHGISADYLAQTMGIENPRGDPNAKNPRSSAGGLFQFTDKTWEGMGGGDKTDPALNIDRAAQLAAQNADYMAERLGRAPTDGELYLAHQQGAKEATYLLKNPDENAISVLKRAGQKNAEAAIVNNGGHADMTAGDFANMWVLRFSGEAARPEGAAVPAEPDVSPPPPTVSAMDEIDRAGATVKAAADLADGKDVDVRDMVQQAVENPRASPGLDESSADPTIPGRFYDDDTATTVRGTDIPVRYAIVEARDLTVSHDADLVRNPNYPDELQPRDRDRAGSQARLLRMEQEFNANLLMRDASAAGGAPIVSPDGVVESGNGRAIVLARNGDRETPISQAYRAALKAKGFDPAGFDNPILVRMRTQAMTGPERVRLSREMNTDTSERYSPTEQAMVDAQQLNDNDVQLYEGGPLTARANDRFARAFLTKAAPGAENSLIDPSTRRLNQAGIERMQAATVAKAYGSKPLVYAIFETSNPQLKTFGAAISEAAPIWAKMRALAANGELAAGADTTPFLVEAMNFVRHIRDNRLNMADVIDKWRDQADMFAKDALSPEALEYLKLFFKDEGFRVQRSGEAIAGDLKDIAEAAIRSTPEPNLFGDVTPFDVSAQINRLNERAAREEDYEPQHPDGPEGASDRHAGDGGWPDRDREAAGGPGSGGDAPGLVELVRPIERADAEPNGGPDRSADAGPVKNDAQAKPNPAEAYRKALFAEAAKDPEIAALYRELAHLEATDPGTMDHAPSSDNPDVIAEAMRAAEFCLREGGA
jgi:hypothetical protein